MSMSLVELTVTDAPNSNKKTAGQQQEIMGKLDDWASLNHSKQINPN